jgi:hypothetical protein
MMPTRSTGPLAARRRVPATWRGRSDAVASPSVMPHATHHRSAHVQPGARGRAVRGLPQHCARAHRDHGVHLLQRRHRHGRGCVRGGAAGAPHRHPRHGSRTFTPPPPAQHSQHAPAHHATPPRAAKIASGQISCAVVGGAETMSDVPIRFSRPIRKRLLRATKARGPADYLKLLAGLKLGDFAPEAPAIAGACRGRLPPPPPNTLPLTQSHPPAHPQSTPRAR